MDQWERNTKMSAMKNNLTNSKTEKHGRNVPSSHGMWYANNSQPSSSCSALRKQVATRNKV